MVRCRLRRSLPLLSDFHVTLRIARRQFGVLVPFLLVLDRLWQYEPMLQGTKLHKHNSTDKYGNFVAKQK